MEPRETSGGSSSFCFWRVFLLLLFLDTSTTDNLDVGKSLNIFGRFAYHSVSMKVVARNDSTRPWLFREPLVPVFSNISNAVSCSNDPVNKIHIEFNMEFCDDLYQLLQAYFRDFYIEGMDEPWRSFSSSWNTNTMAKTFGIDIKHINTPKSYILVRLLRRRTCKKLINPVQDMYFQPLPHVKALADNVTFGNKNSVLKFIKTYGSHYISSFSTGNSLYQVFVLHPPVFERIKARFMREGVNSFTKNELNTIFSPWYSEQVGSVLSASGNLTVTNWANKALLSKSHLYPYTTLMKMYGDQERFKELDKLLDNEALLSLELKTLSPIFKDSIAKQWFTEFLINNMQLWEQNMYSYFGE